MLQNMKWVSCQEFSIRYVLVDGIKPDKLGVVTSWELYLWPKQGCFWIAINPHEHRKAYLRSYKLTFPTTSSYRLKYRSNINVKPDLINCALYLSHHAYKNI